ncbi:MAG TPA: hypothetical protein VII41_01115, partial [Steroidobacteraceae bacterium]
MSTHKNTGRAALRPLLLPILLASLCLPLLPLRAASDDQATQMLGNWLTESRDGIIELSRAADGSYQGKIAGGADPQRLDTHNPDESQRS